MEISYKCKLGYISFPFVIRCMNTLLEMKNPISVQN